MVDNPFIALVRTACLGNRCENRFLTWTRCYLSLKAERTCLTEWFQIHSIHICSWCSEGQERRGLKMQITWCKKTKQNKQKKTTKKTPNVIWGHWPHKESRPFPFEIIRLLWPKSSFCVNLCPHSLSINLEFLHKSFKAHGGKKHNWGVPIKKSLSFQTEYWSSPCD